MKNNNRINLIKKAVEKIQGTGQERAVQYLINVRDHEHKKGLKF